MPLPLQYRPPALQRVGPRAQRGGVSTMASVWRMKGSIHVSVLRVTPAGTAKQVPPTCTPSTLSLVFQYYGIVKSPI